MSLRKKTLLIIGVTLLGLFVLLYASSRNILLQSYVLLENDDIYQNTERGVQAIRTEISTLKTIAVDWAARSRSSAFVQGTDPDYPAVYLEEFDVQRQPAQCRSVRHARRPDSLRTALRSGREPAHKHGQRHRAAPATGARAGFHRFHQRTGRADPAAERPGAGRRGSHHRPPDGLDDRRRRPGAFPE